MGNRTHHRVPTENLQSGPSTRRGKRVALRGYCVQCFAITNKVNGEVRSVRKLSNGKNVPYVTYACDVCRVHLCYVCFKHVYDHGKGGKPSEYVILR